MASEEAVDRTPVRDPSWPESVEIFDTTLRDGTQFEGISVTVEDKLRVAEQLDHLGVAWIEGGWPGANPKDEEFFARARTELDLATSTLVAFGSTRRPKGKVDVDPVLENLVRAGTSTVCIVGKSWDYHVTKALGASLDEGVAMVGESVAFLKEQGLRVFFDAEHCFDGYKRNPAFTLSVLEAAVMAGVDCIVMCDTNGGSLPHEVERIVGEVVGHFGADVQVGIHTQNDTGCAVPNALAAVTAGVTHLQGTMNGYGERTGNADLTQCIPNLTLKMGIRTLPSGHMARLTEVSHHVAELMNMPQQHQQPYVGSSAFAHKAGLHTSAIAKRPDSYEHVDPAAVGNGTRFLVSDLSGKATIELKMKQLGIELDGAQTRDVLEQLKQLEHVGYHFETADGSLELLMRRATGWSQDFFEVESFRVITEHRSGANGSRTARAAENPLGHVEGVETEATIKLRVGGERVVATGEGNGPVNALDAAFRTAVGDRFACLSRVHLSDFKVRVLDTQKGTGAVTRVLIDSTDGNRTWTTIGVSQNIIEASWQALSDAIVFALLHVDG